MTDSKTLVSGVDFVHLGTKDFEAAVHFYGTVLGLPSRVATESTLEVSSRPAT